MKGVRTMARAVVSPRGEARRYVVHLNTQATPELATTTKECAEALDITVSQYMRRALRSYNAAVMQKLGSSKSNQSEVKEPA